MSRKAIDKSVRECTVGAKLVAGDVRVECRRCGIVFGFPIAVWPESHWQQAEWIRRLTPWWDLASSGWTPQSQRLRDSCQIAINKLSAPTQNLVTTAIVNAVPTTGAAAAARETAGECVGAESLSPAKHG